MPIASPKKAAVKKTLDELQALLRDRRALDKEIEDFISENYSTGTPIKYESGERIYDGRVVWSSYGRMQVRNVKTQKTRIITPEQIRA